MQLQVQLIETDVVTQLSYTDRQTDWVTAIDWETRRDNSKWITHIATAAVSGDDKKLRTDNKQQDEHKLHNTTTSNQHVFTGQPGNVPSHQFFSKSSCTFCHSWVTTPTTWHKPRNVTQTEQLCYYSVLSLIHTAIRYTSDIEQHFTSFQTCSSEPSI